LRSLCSPSCPYRRGRCLLWLWVCAAKKCESEKCQHGVSSSCCHHGFVFWLVDRLRSPGLSGAGARAWKCEPNPPSRAYSRPFVRQTHCSSSFRSGA
jgi:hypothetical protein